MNMRREALLWSIAIMSAMIVGLLVVWGVIVLAFNRPSAAPLYFIAPPYRQDDYSIDDVNAPRLNPLDPALEQEAIFEDHARTGDGKLPDTQNHPTATYAAQTERPSSIPTDAFTQTSLPAPSNTLQPVLTNTPGLTTTHIPATATPVATKTVSVPKTQKPPNTQKPANTQKPPTKATKQPKDIDKPPSKATKQPKDIDKPPSKATKQPKDIDKPPSKPPKAVDQAPLLVTWVGFKLSQFIYIIS